MVANKKRRPFCNSMEPMMRLLARAHTVRMPRLVVTIRLERQREQAEITTQTQQRDLTILTLLPLPICMILLPRREGQLIPMLPLALRLILPLQRGHMMPALLPHLVPMILQLQDRLQMLMLLLVRLMLMRPRNRQIPTSLRIHMIPRLARQGMMLWLLRRDRIKVRTRPQHRSNACNEEKRSEERRVGKECRSRWSPY